MTGDTGCKRGVWLLALLVLCALWACGQESSKPTDGDVNSESELEFWVDGDPDPELQADGDQDVESAEIEWLDAPSELSANQKAAACANVARVPNADWDCGPCPSGESSGCKDVQFFVHYENAPCEACADGNLCLSVIEAKCAYHQRCQVDELGEPFCEVPADPYEDGDCDTQGVPCDIDSVTTQGVFCDEYNGAMFFDRASHGDFSCNWGGCDYSEIPGDCPADTQCVDDDLGFAADCVSVPVDGDPDAEALNSGDPCDPAGLDYSKTCASLESGGEHSGRVCPFLCDPTSHTLKKNEDACLNFDGDANACIFLTCANGWQQSAKEAEGHPCSPTPSLYYSPLPGYACDAKGECVQGATDGDPELEPDPEPEIPEAEWVDFEWSDANAFTLEQKNAACANDTVFNPYHTFICGPCSSAELAGASCYGSRYVVQAENVPCAGCAAGTLCLRRIQGECPFGAACTKQAENADPGCLWVADGDGPDDCDMDKPICDFAESATPQGLACQGTGRVVYFEKMTSEAMSCYWGYCNSAEVATCPVDAPCVDDGLGFFAGCGSLYPDGDLDQ